MHLTHARKRASVLLGLLLALAVPTASAFAVSTSATATETLTVSSSITMTGVPATLDYGSVNAGAIAAAPEFTATTSSNNASGWTVTVTASDLTNANGTIAATQRDYLVSGTGFTATGGGSPAPYTGGAFVLANRTTGGSAGVFITSRVNVPAAAVPAAYTGSSTFTASTNP